MLWESFTLHAALALDIFTPLAAGPLSIGEPARRTGCSRRGLDMLVTAACCSFRNSRRMTTARGRSIRPCPV